MFPGCVLGIKYLQKIDRYIMKPFQGVTFQRKIERRTKRRSFNECDVFERNDWDLDQISHVVSKFTWWMLSRSFAGEESETVIAVDPKEIV
jgi:hypothetical protein